jgi:hypothetical protein
MASLTRAGTDTATPSGTVYTPPPRLDLDAIAGGWQHVETPLVRALYRMRELESAELPIKIRCRDQDQAGLEETLKRFELGVYDDAPLGDSEVLLQVNVPYHRGENEAEFNRVVLLIQHLDDDSRVLAVGIVRYFEPAI